MVEVSALKARLAEAFPDGEFVINDLTGTSDHFEGTIVSDRFAGLSLIKQHKLVYAALGEWMGGAIHAFTFKTLTHDAHRAQNKRRLLADSLPIKAFVP